MRNADCLLALTGLISVAAIAGCSAGAGSDAAPDYGVEADPGAATDTQGTNESTRQQESSELSSLGESNVTPEGGGSSESSMSPSVNEDGRLNEGVPLSEGEETNSAADPATEAESSEESNAVQSGAEEGEVADVEPGPCVSADDREGPIGYGEATTGGGAIEPVVVNSFAEAEAALADYRAAFKDGEQSALVLRYTGQFDFSEISDVCEQHEKESRVLQIKEMENVTFEGVSGSSGNFGIKINRAKNVIVRNMTLGLLPGGGDSDAITIEGNGTNGDVENVWIDHNELFSSTKSDCDGAGDTEFDGLIDIKKGARRITISFNHLHDHQKTGLIGHSDSDDMERFVTFHHNWYEDVVSRTPLHRFGYVHLFNNYYSRVTGSGINVRMGGVALIESNFFENVANPVTSRFSDELGFWDLRDNFVGQGITWTTTSDTFANAEDWQSTAEFPEAELSYDYAPEAAGCVKQSVISSAGATL